MSPVIVLGAGGQVGQALLQREPGFVGFARSGCDITKRDEIDATLTRWRPQAVVNCAVYRDVEKAETDYANARRVNHEGVADLAVACSYRNIPLLHLSSDYVFDGENGSPYVEADACDPVNTFGLTKWGGEVAALSVHERCVVIRTSWVFSAVGCNFLTNVLTQAARGEVVMRPADQKGTPTAAAELAEAVVRAVTRLIEDANVAGLYHFAGPDPMTWADLARLIHPNAQDRPPGMAIGAAKRPRNTALASRKFASTFGYEHRPTRDCVREAVAAYEQTPRDEPVAVSSEHVRRRWITSGVG